MNNMIDYSKEDWVEYIKSHLNEFDIQETGPDNKYKLWRIGITSKANRLYSEFGEETDKDKAKELAIYRLASVLYQYYRMPNNLTDY